MPIKNLKCVNCGLDFERIVLNIDKTIAYKCKYCEQDTAYVTDFPLPLANTNKEIHEHSKIIDKGMKAKDWIATNKKLIQENNKHLIN